MRIKGFIVMLFAVFLLAGCGGADQNTQAPLPGSTLTHPADWVNTAAYQAKSINFHGIFVDKNGNQSCTQCHGSDFKGGITGVSCYQCHNGGPTGKHVSGWADPAFLKTKSINFHGIFVNQNGDQSCTQCHGSDLDGGVADVSCYSCHDGPSGILGHPDGWQYPVTESVHFHGHYAKKYSAACTVCHGSDLKGAYGPSCYSCHGKLW